MGSEQLIERSHWNHVYQQYADHHGVIAYHSNSRAVWQTWDACAASMGLRYLKTAYIYHVFDVVDNKKYMMAKLRYGI